LTLPPDVVKLVNTADERWASLKDTLTRQARIFTLLDDRQIFIDAILALPNNSRGEGAAGLLCLFSKMLDAAREAVHRQIVQMKKNGMKDVFFEIKNVPAKLKNRGDDAVDEWHYRVNKTRLLNGDYGKRRYCEGLGVTRIKTKEWMRGDGLASHGEAIAATESPRNTEVLSEDITTASGSVGKTAGGAGVVLGDGTAALEAMRRIQKAVRPWMLL
jgi:hypothetical protein